MYIVIMIGLGKKTAGMSGLTSYVTVDRSGL